MDGLKSKLVDVPSGWAGAPRRLKIILDFQELVNALKRDAVSELVGNVLKNEYGDWKMFSFIVFDLKLLVMKIVADALVDPPPHKGRLGILFRHDLYEELEKGMKDHSPSKSPPDTSYWVGENPSAS